MSSRRSWSSSMRATRGATPIHPAVGVRGRLPRAQTPAPETRRVQSAAPGGATRLEPGPSQQQPQSKYPPSASKTARLQQGTKKKNKRRRPSSGLAVHIGLKPPIQT
jgi:hypothetical protein